MIIDTHTTTLLQAIATKLPVFVHISVIRWPEEAINLLKNRVCCGKNAKDMIVSVEQYVRNGTYDSDFENNDFLIKYGIHNGDAVNRALHIIKDF